MRRMAVELCGVEPTREPSGVLPAPVRNGSRGPGGHMHGTLTRDGSGPARDFEGGSSLRAAGSGVSAGSAGIHAGTKRLSGGAERAASDDGPVVLEHDEGV